MMQERVLNFLVVLSQVYLYRRLFNDPNNLALALFKLQRKDNPETSVKPEYQISVDTAVIVFNLETGCATVSSNLFPTRIIIC